LIRVLASFAICVVTLNVHAAEPPKITDGVWVHLYEKWVPNPSESGRSWSASASALRLCPNGSFLLTSGVLYRHESSVAFGSSDGLRMYSGSWKRLNNLIEVRYKLFSSEIDFTGDDHLKNKESIQFITSKPKFIYFKKIKYFSASELPSTLSDNFIECPDK